MVKVHFGENALIVGKSVGTRPKNARSAKGTCKVVALEKVKRAILVMVAPEGLQFLWSEGASKIPMVQEQS